MIHKDLFKWPIIHRGRSLLYVTATTILIVSIQAAAGDKRKKVKDKGIGREGEDETERAENW